MPEVASYLYTFLSVEASPTWDLIIVPQGSAGQSTHLGSSLIGCRTFQLHAKVFFSLYLLKHFP